MHSEARRHVLLLLPTQLCWKTGDLLGHVRSSPMSPHTCHLCLRSIHVREGPSDSSRDTSSSSHTNNPTQSTRSSKEDWIGIAFSFSFPLAGFAIFARDLLLSDSDGPSRSQGRRKMSRVSDATCSPLPLPCRRPSCRRSRPTCNRPPCQRPSFLISEPTVIKANADPPLLHAIRWDFMSQPAFE